MPVAFRELIQMSKKRLLIFIFEAFVLLGFTTFLIFLLCNAEFRDWLFGIVISFSWTKAFCCLAFFLTSIYALYRISGVLVKYYGENYALTFRKKIAFVLGSIAIVPILALSIFMLFLYSSMQVWFDERVRNTVAKAVSISEIYLKDHKSRLITTATQLMRDVESKYGSLLNKERYIADFLNKYVDSGLFSEAVIFKVNPTLILAKTDLSFFSLNALPLGFLSKVAPGMSIEINSDLYGIQVLSRFLRYEDTYLIVTKAPDKQVMEYLDETYGAVSSYSKLEKTITTLKARFILALCAVALFLLGGSVYTIVAFARQITSPLQDLVNATTLVQEGQLDVRVPVSLNKDEISTLGKAFNVMVIKLKNQRRDLLIAQKSLAWSEVARRVAHEINNPLTPIKLSAEILQSRFGSDVKNPQDFKKYTSNIVDYVDDIKNIVSAFVHFAKLPQPSFQKCLLFKWLSSVVEVRRNTKPYIKYVLNNMYCADFEIMCDVSQISQVINNLLTNAEEALFERKNNPEISISIQKEVDNCKICITDNGPGFALQILERATEPYVSTKSRSSGLGLAIVDKIIKDHNGFLEFSNQECGGANVTIILPQKQSEI